MSGIKPFNPFKQIATAITPTIPGSVLTVTDVAISGGSITNTTINGNTIDGGTY